MSAKAISEQTGKELLYKYICTTSAIQNRFRYARVTPDTDWDHLLQDHPWLLSQRLVVKPDQLIKRRGKLGLVGVNLTLDGVKSWLKPRLGQEALVGKARGLLKNFLIEPFVPHSQAEEFYVCIYATREGDYVLFHHEGGVDVGDVDAKAQKLLVGVDEKLNPEDIKKHLLVHAPKDKKEILASFISGLFNLYEDLYFTYLEINPLVMTSICDERGQELIYAGMPITEVFKEEMGIGGVLGLLWFQRRLPKYSCQFIEMCLMVTADHGPAVSGAHNTIICARAGKDLVSSLTSGLLTIGDRFGGALDAAAKMFSKAFDSGIIPMEFVNKMKKEGKLIMGIGHRVKSINNPDMRVQILKDYVKQHFPATPLLDYALEVEKITTSKKPNLILNVDGFIGVAFVDMLRNCGSFTREEADEYIDIGALNGIFVLGRSMGFIGHYLDQKRLKQGLYRHPWDDISYVLPEHMSM
uniref:ATP citrate lyase n=1 Tax=Rousettus aegyptiacus TaxID=9407 RepID=A0A7J8G4A8_ROUAE|nr:ATP citrate lyase [Rousettus aegyptiacus]